MSVLEETKELFGRILGPASSDPERLVSRQIKAPVAYTITLESAAFEPEAEIPLPYSGEGKNVSPPLNWAMVPPSAKELIIICEDPDAPRSDPYIHWVIYNIPPDVTALPEAVPPGKHPNLSFHPTQAYNSSGTNGYTGPMPPAGHGIHHYHFQIFAMDKKLVLSDQPTNAELVEALRGRTIGQGELVGLYERS